MAADEGGSRMEHNVKLLTVLVPAYQERATLRASLQRLLSTDLPVDFEVIVVDDGSTDGGSETISDLVDGQRVRLTRHDRNRGKGQAIRTGIELARGDLFTILDADL